jgi:hypothetical protein
MALPSSLTAYAPIGDPAAQAAQGGSIVDAISSAGNSPAAVQSLSAIGFSLFSGVTGKGQAIVTDAMQGASTGMAMAGPYGFAIGFTIGAIQGFVDVLSTPNLVIVGASKATELIYGDVQAMASSRLTALSVPVGVAMLRYLGYAYPPRTTRRPALLQSLAVGGQWSGLPISVYPNIPAPVPASRWLASEPSDWKGADNHNDPGVSPYAADNFFDWAAPTPASWANYTYRWLTENGGIKGPASALLKDWTQSTFAAPHLSQEEIVKRAIARRFDPLWYSVNLYGAWSGSALSGDNVTLFAPDLANAIATVAMMYSAGASTRAVLTELYQHAYVIHQSGQTLSSLDGPRVTAGLGPTKAQTLSEYRWSQHCFFAFLDDVTLQARAEDGDRSAAAILAGKTDAPSHPSSPSSGMTKAEAAATVDEFVREYSAAEHKHHR